MQLGNRSWSISLFREYGPVLTLGSILALRRALVLEKRQRVAYQTAISIRLKTGRRSLVLRPASNDLYTFREVFIEGVYEPLRRHVCRGRTIVDVGANIGLASVFFRQCWPKAEIVCVEPAADNCELLARNLQPDIEQGKCRVVRGAAWHRSGTCRFAPLKKGHVNQRHCHEGDEDGEEVLAYSIGDIVVASQLSFVDVMKIDVEGAETVLFCDDASWLDMVGVLAIEFHGSSRRDSNFDKVVRGKGFVVVGEHGHTVVAKRLVVT